MDHEPAAGNPFRPPEAVVVEVTAQRQRMPGSVKWLHVPVLGLFSIFMAGGLESVKELPTWQAALVLAAGGAIAGVPVALLLLGLHLRGAWVWWTLGTLLLAGSVLETREVFFSHDEGWRHYLRGGPLDAMELALCPMAWLTFALWMSRSARAWFRKPAPAAAKAQQAGID